MTSYSATSFSNPSSQINDIYAARWHQVSNQWACRSHIMSHPPIKSPRYRYPYIRHRSMWCPSVQITLSFPAASWTFVREIEEEEEKSSPFAFLTLVPRQAYGPTATDECLTAVFVLLSDGRLQRFAALCS